LILVAGLWGGLVPFVAPYFHFALGPNHSWTWTSGRLYLSVLPAIAAIVGGVLLVASGPRAGGKLGALLALAGGAWFAVGPTVSLLWATDAEGLAHGHKVTRMLELLTYHTGLGVLIATFAAYALPGLAFRRAVAPATAARATPAAAAARATPAAAAAPTRPAAAAAPATDDAPTTAAPAAAGAPARRGGLFSLFRRRAATTDGSTAGSRGVAAQR
jgi:hypothetical protein